VPAWLRGLAEVLIAQVAIWLLAGLAAGVFAAILAGPDAMNPGPVLGMRPGGLPGFAVAFTVLWVLAWRR